MRVRARYVFLALLALIVVLVLGAITSIGWAVVFGPKMRPVTARTFERTPARLARGEYLVSVAPCFFCHSEHDLSSPDVPRNEAKKGAGWELPIPELGHVRPPNITPDPETGIGAWTDDEIARAMQEGVDKSGRPLFPIMPYLNFRNLDDEDLASIIVYLRTIPPVRNVVPVTQLIFPLNVLVKTLPQPLTTRPPRAPRTTPEARGEYLVKTVIGCPDCHTPADQGKPLPGLSFAGGEPIARDVRYGGAMVFSKNITSDPSGIQHYDETMFRNLLRTGATPGGKVSQLMPFETLKNLTDADIHDIYSYIKTLPPVKHRVSNTDPPTKCRVCGRVHGLGELN